jgi:hypothetical protein
MGVVGAHQVDVGAGREQRFFVEDGDRLVAGLPERAFAVVFLVGHPRQRLLEGLHEPAEVLEPGAVAGHAGGVLALVVDPGLNGGWVIDVEA